MEQESNPSPERQRRAVLAPYLIRLKTLRSGQTATGGLQLDAWERGVVEKIDGTPENGWSTLVAEGIAFRTKYADDLRRLESDPDAADVVRAQLATDAAVGLALMAETQQTVNLLVLSGEIDVAKKLSGFRNKIAQGLSTIRETIGEAAFRGAQTNSTRMTVDRAAHTRPAAHAEGIRGGGSPEAPYSGEPLDINALIAELPDAFIRRSAPSARPIHLQITTVDEGSPRRIKGLLIILAALVVVWCVLVLPKLGGVEPLPLLTEQQMPQNAAIRELMARPPSLFVEVDGTRWKQLSRGERGQLVKEVGEIAAASGYTGVQFRDTHGSSVAQWLQSQGVWLANTGFPD